MVAVRVAFILPSLQGGGAERVALTLIKEFVELGHEVDLVLARKEGQLLPLVPPEIRIVDLGAKRFRNALRPLIRYLRRRRPDAVQVSMWPLTIVALLAHRMARSTSRIIVSDHAILSLQYAGRALPWLARTVRAFYPWASGRVAVSSAVADDLARVARIDRDSFEVIHNPVPEAEQATPAQRAAAERAWGSDGARLLAVGVIKREKNYPLLLEAFAALRERTQSRLVIIGDGPERRELEAVIADRGLSEHVHLAGYQSSLAAWYDSAHVFVLSSDEEGFANVLVEAMRCGLPVVSTDCGGPREILEGGTYGALVPIRDAEALASAIKRTLDKPTDAGLLKERAEELSGAASVQHYVDLLTGQGRTKSLRRL